MMVSSPTLLNKERPFLFKPVVPASKIKELYQHLSEDKTLFLIVIAGEINQVFITQETPQSSGSCYVFWKKSDAYVYAGSCGLSKDKTKIWETSLKDIIRFAEKMNGKDAGNKEFDVIAGTFHEGVLLDVDLVWSKNNFMV